MEHKGRREYEEEVLTTWCVQEIKCGSCCNRWGCYPCCCTRCCNQEIYAYINYPNVEESIKRIIRECFITASIVCAPVAVATKSASLTWECFYNSFITCLIERGQEEIYGRVDVGVKSRYKDEDCNFSCFRINPYDIPKLPYNTFY